MSTVESRYRQKASEDVTVDLLCMYVFNSEFYNVVTRCIKQFNKSDRKKKPSIDINRRNNMYHHL
jgi:hypothetical protein